jgi:hypothetical protein
MINLAPRDNQTINISNGSDDLGDFDYTEIAEVMQTLHGAYPGQCLLIIDNGWHANANAVNTALELAGLSGLQAAKQRASGQIKF